MLVAHGDQGGGYLLVIDTDHRGEPVAWFGVNAYGVVHRTPPIGLALGESELLVQLQVRPRFRLNVLLTDGRAATTLTDLPQLVGMAPFTGISVGADRGGPVDWEVHRRAAQPPVHRRAAHRPLRARTAVRRGPGRTGPGVGRGSDDL